MSVEPLQDEEAFNIRTSLIKELSSKNQELNDQIEKIEQELHFNNRVISQLREITPIGPFQASLIESSSWKKRARKLQAYIKTKDPCKKKLKQTVSL
jgi:hypothetical protein